mmetsp:Transcript_4109/g.7520  ORF Transcript_4109/g.7520 Transcript_4109/m.7520 type:complete len:162 (+) Transcript_4109:65-550(+)
MQSFYPERHGKGQAPALRPEDVWRAVCLIPRGCVSTYGDVSRALGNGWSPRSVGQALKKNPYAPVVPCHRIVKADRSLGGYFGATSPDNVQVQAKMRLLEEEGVCLECNSLVKREHFWHFPSDIDLEAVLLPADDALGAESKSMYPAKQRLQGERRTEPDG